jgi:hypothetical protein
VVPDTLRIASGARPPWQLVSVKPVSVKPAADAPERIELADAVLSVRHLVPMRWQAVGEPRAPPPDAGRTTSRTSNGVASSRSCSSGTGVTSTSGGLLTRKAHVLVR